MFEVSAANSSFIRATATISDPVGLNGIRMTCQSEDILLNFEFGKVYFSTHYIQCKYL